MNQSIWIQDRNLKKNVLRRFQINLFCGCKNCLEIYRLKINYYSIIKLKNCYLNYVYRIVILISNKTNNYNNIIIKI